MFNKIVKQEQPFLQLGYGRSKQLSQLFRNGFFEKGYGDFNFRPTMKQIENMPGYKFQLEQGQKALQSSDSATIGALSGPAMKDLLKFNQGLASQYEQQYFNQALQNYQTNQGNFYTNQTNIFNRLSQIASLGQNAAGNLGSQGASLGTGIAQAQAGAGASQAAGQIGSANAYAGAANNIPLYALLANSNASNSNAGSSGSAIGGAIGGGGG